jgi:hypothetical protein
MDNVQKANNVINIPSPQTFGSHLLNILLIIISYSSMKSVKCLYYLKTVNNNNDDDNNNKKEQFLIS